MSRLPRPDECEGYTYTPDCPECDGAGGKRTIVPMRGEYMAADIYEDVCPECEGTGATDELLCQGCDAPIPDSGLCVGCDTLHLDAVKQRRAA